MAEIKVSAEDFNLTSEWTVVTGSNGVKEITSGPSTASRPVTFAYELPAGAKVKSAKVHADWGNPLSGFATRTINGVTPDGDGFVEVEIDPAATSITVTFRFKANGNTTATGNRSAVASMTEVYLLIETKGGSGYLYRLENGELVPYKFHRVENGTLISYLLMCTLDPSAITVSQFCTSAGESLYTADGQHFKALEVTA